ncbi:MAG: LysE family translocator, partial [Baekduiaceae bacterium]
MSAAFLLTTLVVVATPGTGALYTIATGIARGARQSIVAAFGCTLGCVPHMVAAITGLAALMHASAMAFQTVKWAGVAYLLYLAWATWRDRTDLDPAADGRPPRSARHVVRTAVLINLLNPKLTIFFFAFLPQFVAADAPHPRLEMAGLSAVFMAATFGVFAIYGLGAAAVRERVLRRPRVVAWMRRSFAAAYVGGGR